MSLYSLARFNTSPDSVHFACKNGIAENPLYLQCDKCGNVFCDVRDELDLLAEIEDLKNGKPPSNLEDCADVIKKINRENPPSVNFFDKFKSMLRELL